MNAMRQSLIETLQTAAAFPFHYDVATGQVVMVALAPDALARAAFLDQRVLTPSSARTSVAIAEFEAAAAALPPRLPNMIFHQGHCGSTLISRLIAKATQSRGLREPLVLRAFAALFADVSAGDATMAPPAATRSLTLFLRCFSPGAVPAIVKASSVCTDLAEPLLKASADLRALFVHVQPEVYLATMLAGQNNRVDLSAFSAVRRKRLRNRGVQTPPVYELSEGRLAALAWLCEAVSFDAAPDDGRIMSLDFDAFLASPLPALRAASVHLGLQADDAGLAAAVNGPDMRTYSKAQEHQYSPALRSDVLNQARLDFAAEIADGLDFLATLAARSDVARNAIRRLQAPGAAAKISLV